MLIGAVIVLVIIFLLLSRTNKGLLQHINTASDPAPEAMALQVAETRVNEAGEIEDVPASAREMVEQSEYTIDISQSAVGWSAGKPRLPGYINTGTLALSEGTILVEEAMVSGEFVFDMTKLAVTDTPMSVGLETELADVLKEEAWFDVVAYPTATFEITEVRERENSETTFIYDVTGTLTLKGVADTVTFPALIFLDENGLLRISASFTFDRTKFGVTALSGTFFSDLGEAVVDDMVQISLNVVGEG